MVIEQFFEQLMAIIPVVIVMVLSFFVMRTAFGVHVRLHRYSYDSAIKTGNGAAAIRFSGVFFGSTLAFWGVIAPTELGIVHDLIRIVQTLLCVIVFMMVAGYVNDKLMLFHFNNLQEIFVLQNKSVATIEFGSFVATGLIFSGSQADGGTFLGNVGWFICGQVLLIACFYLFTFSRKGFGGVEEMQTVTEDRDMGYALSLAGFLISVGIVLRVVIGNVQKPEAAVAALIVWLLITAILQYYTNRLIVRGENLKNMIGTNENKSFAAGVIEGTMFLSSALVITVLN